MSLALATVMVYGALDVVLFEAPRRVKVLITIITDAVMGRVCDVLAVRVQGSEIAVATIAGVGHR